MEAIVIRPKNKRAIVFLKNLLSKLNNVESVEVIDLDENTPNAETIKAIMEARNGKGIKAKNVSELIERLNA